MYDGSSVGAGSKPARPSPFVGAHTVRPLSANSPHPGGVNYSEGPKGPDTLSGSGARGTAGQPEEAAGQ
jgi:hypothetical protein